MAVSRPLVPISGGFLVNQEAVAGVLEVSGEVPLGLLELAERRVIRENVYHVVPLPGVVWAAVRRTLLVCFARSWGSRGIYRWRWRIGLRVDGEGKVERFGSPVTDSGKTPNPKNYFAAKLPQYTYAEGSQVEALVWAA